MPARSKIERLPKRFRDQLDKKLVASAFGDYVAIASWLAEQGAAIGLGAERIPKKSSMHRYGVKLQAKLEEIRASNEGARLPKDYLRREDHIRFETGINRKLNALKARIDFLEKSQRASMVRRGRRSS